MKRILAFLLATALLGGCAIVPAGHGHGYRGDGYRDNHYDRYDRHDGGSYRDGRGWRDGDDRGR